jgi:hypothetical protein
MAIATKARTPVGNPALTQLEWRGYAILADTFKVIATVATPSEARWVIFYYGLRSTLKSIAANMREMGGFIHSRESVVSFEQATLDQLGSIVFTMENVHRKTVDMVKVVRSIDAGAWSVIYARQLDAVEAYSLEIENRAKSFRQTDSARLLLTKRDQDILVESLLNPPEPNDALRQAFGISNIIAR